MRASVATAFVGGDASPAQPQIAIMFLSPSPANSFPNTNQVLLARTHVCPDAPRADWLALKTLIFRVASKAAW